MYSETDIANLALGNIAHSVLVADYDTEKTKEARGCRLYYPLVRKATIADFDWSFARRAERLALLSGEESEQYQYVYSLPDDCLVVRRIEQYMSMGGSMTHNDNLLKYEKGLSKDGKTKTLLTNTPEASIVYTADIKDTALMPPTLVDSLTWRLAARLATYLAKSPKLAVSCMEQYTVMSGIAAEHDANSNQIENDYIPDSVTARLS